MLAAALNIVDDDVVTERDEGARVLRCHVLRLFYGCSYMFHLSGDNMITASSEVVSTSPCPLSSTGPGRTLPCQEAPGRPPLRYAGSPASPHATSTMHRGLAGLVGMCQPRTAAREHSRPYVYRYGDEPSPAASTARQGTIASAGFRARALAGWWTSRAKRAHPPIKIIGRFFIRCTREVVHTGVLLFFPSTTAAPTRSSRSASEMLDL